MRASTQWQLAQSAAERYERVLVPAILRPAAKVLVDFLPWKGGETVLDAGCGTGAALGYATEKVGSKGHLVGLDVNQGMLAVAAARMASKEVAPQWVNASLYEMPFGDGHFDVVLCAQTLQFLKERQRALLEIRRVLKPAGMLGLSLWCGIEESPYFQALTQAITRHVGASTAVGLQAAFGLTGDNEIRDLVATAHDPDGEVRAVELTNHPFFVATLFQPERVSLAGKPCAPAEALVSACRFLRKTQ